MKILLLNCVFKKGSTGKIIASLHEGLLNKGHKSFVFYGTGTKLPDKFVRRICGIFEHYFNALLSRAIGIPFGGVFLSNRRIEKFIREEKPDIVHIHCINGSMINIYNLLSFLGKNNIKTIITLHAEFFYTGSCSHAFNCQKWIDGCNHCAIYKEFLPSFFFERSQQAWLNMKEAFATFNKENLIITSVSSWLMKRAKQSSILKTFNNVYVPNGVDTNVFKRYHCEKRSRPCVLFVTPHFEPNNPMDQKGGRFLLEIAELCPNYDFIIVATTSSFKSKKLPNNVSFLGRINNQVELAKIYSNSDVTLVLSKRETFSMVTAESLCCGTPVVGFCAGGPESIAIKDFSVFVNYGDIKAIIDAIKKTVLCNYDSCEIERIAAEQYAFNTVTQLYVNVYKNLIHE